MKKKIIVFGGAGFIGSQLVKKLALDEQNDIMVYDNFFTGRKENLSGIKKKIQVIKGDIIDDIKVSKVIIEFNPDVVYHLAAIHYIPYCNEHPAETIRVNVEGTEVILQACRKISLKKLIYASSAAIYPIYDFANLEDDIPNPCDIYGYTKYFGERLAQQFYNDTGATTVNARFFNAYGPNETNPHVIPRILDELKAKKNIIVLGNILPKRDFIYVGDLADALVELKKDNIKGFEVFNIGSGKEYSVEETVNYLSKIIGKKLKIKTLKNLKRKVERMHLLSDITRIQKKTKWSPKFSFYDGLKETAIFYKII